MADAGNELPVSRNIQRQRKVRPQLDDEAEAKLVEYRQFFDKEILSDTGISHRQEPAFHG